LSHSALPLAHPSSPVVAHDPGFLVRCKPRCCTQHYLREAYVSAIRASARATSPASLLLRCVHPGGIPTEVSTHIKSINKGAGLAHARRVTYYIHTLKCSFVLKLNISQPSNKPNYKKRLAIAETLNALVVYILWLFIVQMKQRRSYEVPHNSGAALPTDGLVLFLAG